jgi:radical SAM/Cys-rich protein
LLDTRPLLLSSHFPAVNRGQLTTLQVNLGYLCNLSCVHCHVNAGPTRTELMDLDTIEAVLEVCRLQGIDTLDLTGGAPEMNPHFRYLVSEANKLGLRVIDRCNLTVLLEPGYEDMAVFLAENNVVITASLPCYSEENVEQQRGKGVYHDSIEVLRQLNALGYGTRLELNLVFNPVGPVLPPSQAELEQDYKRELRDQHGIHFNQLLTITNMPISRFGAVLLSHNQFDDYMDLLKDNYSQSNMATLMCRSLVSVDWQGNLFDCDFNQMLNMPMLASDKEPMHIRDLLASLELSGTRVATAEHCYGCTAGQGSSCGGALDG